jgi:hypothetical protein
MPKDDHTSTKVINRYGPAGFIMFVAFVGAFVYFTRNEHNIGDILIAFVKALVWPGFVIYHVLQLLGA